MIDNLVRDNVKKLVPYEVKVYEDMVKLDANENNQLTGVFNKEIGKALLDLKINEYPDSDSSQLRRYLAEKLQISWEELVLGCGSDQLITMIINAFVGKGDRILTFSPTFGMYKIGGDLVEATTVSFPLKKDFSLDYDNFMDLVKEDKWKVIFLTNPNNPTGGIIPRQEIINIIETANAIVVVDEAYYEFYGESVIDLVGKYPNLIVLRTLSKAYGLAGARVGYGAACRSLMEVLYKVKPPYNVSNLSQLAARVCLENQELMEESVEEIISQRNEMTRELTRVAEIKVYKSYANFLLCKIDGAEDLYNYLLENKVLVRYFGEEGPLANCLRITIGTREENQLVMELINEYFKND